MNSEPAFPCTNEQFTHGNPQTGDAWPGMTLRDWFAGRALPQVMAIYAVANGHMIGTDHFPRNCAAHAYKMADAMLAARAEGKAS